MSKTSCQAIPSRRIVLSDASQLPADYSTTPGGTLFSTTPGGTRIIYDRAFLLECRNSPLTRSPPPNLPKIPGVTCPQTMKTKENGHTPEAKAAKPAGGYMGKSNKKTEHVDEPQFHMDI